MMQRLIFCASALVIALAPISGHAQTRSRHLLDLAGDRDARAGSHVESNRLIAVMPQSVFSRQMDAESTKSFFDHSAVWSGSPAQGTFVQVQDASPSWPQWAQNPQHTGFLNVAGQNLNQILANIVYDPLVPDEQAHNGGDLLAHYQTPLVDGNDVYMESKAGSYTAGDYATQTWHQNKFTWLGGQLTKIWTFDSDWAPPGSQHDFWEPVYHAVLANGVVYDPGAGGSIFKLNKSNGAAIKRIVPSQFLNPDGSLNAHTFTVSPLTADSSGNIYYNVLKLQDNGNFYHNDAVDSWLVKVTPDDKIQLVSYTALNPAAPQPTDQCFNAFSASQLPWPPSATAIPPTVTCGLQRVALNVAPAIAPDGTIYSVTRAHFISRYGFLIAVNPDLTLKWATSLRGNDRVPGDYFSGGYMADGCGVPASAGGLIPPNGAPGGCRVGARLGVDPATNRLGGGRVLDDQSSSPVVAPDGSIIYGAFTRYNYDQGHLMRFSSSGQFLSYFNFGWDITPGIYQHDGTYSIVIKNNHYGDLAPYMDCGNPTLCPTNRDMTTPTTPEQYFITQLSPTGSGLMSIEWSFQNTNTLSCTRNGDGSITCVDDHPHGFEWCVNAPVIDSDGVVYANSEDGNLFAIIQGGALQKKIFQQLALGAAYTPASLGGDGKIYSQNAGHLFVVGK
jgi:hypothetical protein